MRYQRYFAVSLSTIFLAACTTTTIVPTEDPVPVIEDITPSLKESRLNDCKYLMRDLSMDWSSRRYWCGSPSSENSTESNLREKRNKAMLAAIERTRLRLSVLRERMNTVTRRTDDVATKIHPHLKQQSSVNIKKPSMIKTKLSPAKHSDTDQTHRIVFARGRVTLGPKGRLQALGLIPIIQNARQITVRGRLMDDEFQLDDPLADERRSVGRSYSVRELWRSAGVDVTALTILHYSPDVSGKFVEVMIDE